MHVILHAYFSTAQHTRQSDDSIEEKKDERLNQTEDDEKFFVCSYLNSRNSRNHAPNYTYSHPHSDAHSHPSSFFLFFLITIFSSSFFFFISSLSPFSHFMSFSSSFFRFFVFSFFQFLILILISSFSHSFFSHLFSSSFSLFPILPLPLSDLSNKSLHLFNHSIQPHPSFFHSTKTAYIEKYFNF
jgi:magnesium-transporting ATPase (P-type)